MLERFSAYKELRSLNVDYKAFNTASDIVVRKLSKYYSNLRIVSIHDAISTLPSSSSAGYPFQPGVRKGAIKGKLARLANSQWQRVARGKGILVAPCRSAARRQIRLRGTNKPRLVWAYPGYINVLEAQFGAPLMEVKPPFLGWSLNWLDYGRSVERLRKSFYFSGAMSIDFSSFDSTIPAFMIREAFSILRSFFELNSKELKMFKELEVYFINTPLHLYDKVVVKHRGIPSGSYFTQIIGSIVNMLACYYSSLRSNQRVRILSGSIWMGDDSLLKLSDTFSSDDMEYYFLRYFKELGLKISIDKTEIVAITDDYLPMFLSRRVYLHENKIEFDHNKLCAQVLLPEKRDVCSADAEVRLIGLAWAYGFDKQFYTRLLMAVVYLRRRFGKNDLSQVRIPRYLSYKLGLDDLDLTQFPSYEQIKSRYYGTVSTWYPYKPGWFDLRFIFS
jgi:hypothetical protein